LGNKAKISFGYRVEKHPRFFLNHEAHERRRVCAVTLLGEGGLGMWEINFADEIYCRKGTQKNAKWIICGIFCEVV
jgi:hypothetical protein